MHNRSGVSRIPVVFGAVVFALVSTQAQALDLTGTWASKTLIAGTPMLKCTYFGGTKIKAFEPVPGTLEITQGGVNGTQLFIRMLGARHLVGQAVADVNDSVKGQAGAIVCDHTGDRNYGVFIPKVNDAKGTMNIEIRGLLGDIGLGGAYPITCKGTLLRTSTADPIVTECP